MTEKSVAGLEKALAYGGETHSLGDVVRQVMAGEAQMWEDGDAVIVTEVHTFPRDKVLHFWLAAGDMSEVVELSHRALEWGRENGCSRATLAGRKGWERALANEGWAPLLTVLGREV